MEASKIIPIRYTVIHEYQLHSSVGMHTKNCLEATCSFWRWGNLIQLVSLDWLNVYEQYFTLSPLILEPNFGSEICSCTSPVCAQKAYHMLSVEVVTAAVINNFMQVKLPIHFVIGVVSRFWLEQSELSCSFHTLHANELLWFRL